MALFTGLATLAAVASGRSRRFRDPSLLTPQMVATLVLALGMIHFFHGEARCWPSSLKANARALLQHADEGL